MSINIDYHSFRILYFSGTGNSAYAARALASNLAGSRILNLDEVLKESAVFTDEEKARNILRDFIGNAGTLILVYPVYAADLPWVMRRALDFLSCDGGKRRLAVVATVASRGDDACYRPFALLNQELWQPLHAAYVIMPNNFKVPPFGFFSMPESEEQIRAFREPVDTAIKDICDQIKSGKPRPDLKTSGIRRFGLMQRMTDWILRWVFSRFSVTDDCNGCGKCAAECPTSNINLTGNQPHFGRKCAFCMRCYSFCPQQAICIGKKSKDTERYPRYKGFF